MSAENPSLLNQRIVSVIHDWNANDPSVRGNKIREGFEYNSLAHALETLFSMHNRYDIPVIIDAVITEVRINPTDKDS